LSFIVPEYLLGSFKSAFFLYLLIDPFQSLLGSFNVYQFMST